MSEKRKKQSITNTVNIIIRTVIWKINRLAISFGLKIYATLWFSTMVLGIYGFYRYFQLKGLGSPWGEILYQTFQLFVLKSGNFDWSNVPFVWQLEIARWLALLFASITASVLILLGLFSKEIQSLILWTTRDHVIICGSGRIGSRLVKEFGKKYTVVVIEQDKQNKVLESLRQSGVSVILGNAKHMNVLKNAGVERAKYLIAALGDDNANAEVIIQTQRLVENRKGEPLLCFAGIDDPTLCDLIKVKEFDYNNQGNLKLEFFNFYEKGASAIFENCPMLSNFSSCNVNEHMLIIGLGSMGESLAIRAAKNCRNNFGITEKKLNITVVDLEATDKIKLLYFRYPRLEAYCNIVGEKCDMRFPDFLETTFPQLISGEKPITAIFICVTDDSDGLSTAFLLHQRLSGKSIPIIVRLNNGEGLSALLNEQNKGSVFENIYAFDLWESTCNLSIINGTHEIIAQAIHEEYFYEQQKNGVAIGSKPTMHPWKELSEEIKGSNRDSSYHLKNKMEATLCYISKLTDWKEPDFIFEPFEIIRLGIMEHERWCKEKSRSEWKYNKHRDDSKKQHDTLLPWAELSAEDKKKDFDTVIKLPLVLYRADLKICRMDVIKLIAQAFFQYDLEVNKKEIKTSSQVRKGEETCEKTWCKASEDNKIKYLTKANIVKTALDECGFGITGYIESEKPPLNGIVPEDVAEITKKYETFCPSDHERRKSADEVKMWPKIFISSKMAIYNVKKQREVYENDLRLLDEMIEKRIESGLEKRIERELEKRIEVPVFK